MIYFKSINSKIRRGGKYGHVIKEETLDLIQLVGKAVPLDSRWVDECMWHEWVFLPGEFIINMSYIIDQFAASPLWRIDPHSLSPSRAHPNTRGLSDLPRQSQRDTLLSALAKHKGKFLSLATTQDQFVGQLLTPGERLAILSIKTRRHRGVIMSVRLLTPDGKPLAILPRAQRLIYCKLASVKSLEFSMQELKVQVGMSNGEVRLESPSFHFDDGRGVERLLGAILGGLRACLDSWPVQYARQMSQANENTPLNQRDPATRKLYYYSQFSNIFINLAVGPNNEELFLLDQQHKEDEAIAYLKKHYKPSSLGCGESLFSCIDAERVRCEVANFDIPVLQRDQIISETSLAKASAPTNSNLVPYVLSHIQLGNLGDNVQLRQLNTGGFSNIYLANTVEMKFVQSFRAVGQPSEPLKGFTPQRRPVVVKRDHPGSRVSRVAHERRIMQHIKCGMARFLPSYYIVTDEGSRFANDLLMDYLYNYHNLATYLQIKRETLTLQSKIYILHMLVQALRYLQSYRIVHMDLKPENLMISRKMMIKVIDFGEAYHPEVKGHPSGFTAPYSAPENYLHNEQCTHKNDVFSLGVILHELVFGFKPFVICDEKLREQAYKRSAIHQYWMFAPQQGMSFGERTTLPILRLLIGKCLSPNPAERPQLEWIMLVLRKCIYITWGQQK